MVFINIKKVFILILFVVYVFLPLQRPHEIPYKNIKNRKGSKIKEKLKESGYLFKSKKGGKKLSEIYICVLYNCMQ